MELAPAPVVHQKEEKFFRKKYNASVAFAVGILLFLMPFTQLKCGSMVIAGNTGIGIATGSPWKVMMEDLIRGLGDSGKSSPSDIFPARADIFLLACIIVAFAGLLISMTNIKWKNITAMCAGLLALVMLIAVIIEFRILLTATLSRENANKEMPGLNSLVKINFTIWYYLTMASFAAASFFSYKHMRYDLQDEMDRMIRFEFQEEHANPT